MESVLSWGARSGRAGRGKFRSALIAGLLLAPAGLSAWPVQAQRNEPGQELAAPGGAPAQEGGDAPFLSDAPGGAASPKPGAQPRPGTKDEDAPFLSESPDEPEAAGPERAPAGGTGSAAGEGAEPPSRARLYFQHRYRVLGGVNETRGIFFFFTGEEVLRELRLLNSYEQTIRIQPSATDYKFVKFSIDFSQNYDRESEQFFDRYFVFNETYLNHRSGPHQWRWGNQVIRLGRIDIDSPIDVLHFQNIVSILTLDSETSRDSVPAVSYEHFGADQHLTLIASPIAQRTIGMRFTEFRRNAEDRDANRQPGANSFLRDHVGVQYQWLGSTYDLQLGLFHWFDNSPHVRWQYLGGSATPDEPAFEGLINRYREEERITNFATLEFDKTWGSWGLKSDLGVFDKKNMYSYARTPEGDITFDTARVPYVAGAVSLEKTFPIFFILVIYSLRWLQDVPPDTHLLLYENERVPADETRNLHRQSLFGVFKWLIGDDYAATLVVGQTEPFVQQTVYGTWTWRQRELNSEWELKLLRYQTETLVMHGVPIESNQAFVSYIRRFSAE